MKTNKNETLMVLKALVRKNGAFFIRAERKRENGVVPSWSSFATFEFHARPRISDESKYMVVVDGFMGNGHNDEATTHQNATWKDSYTGVYRPMSGHWSLWNEDVVRSAILGLPNDAKVWFEVRLDAMTNPLMVSSGLHGDKLALVGEWSRSGRTHRREFILDVNVSKHNSARFGNAESMDMRKSA